MCKTHQAILLILFVFSANVYSQQLKGDLIIRNVSVIDVINGIVAGSKDIAIINDRISEIIPHIENTNYLPNYTRTTSYFDLGLMKGESRLGLI